MASRASVLRKRTIKAIENGEVIYCGICGDPLVAKAKGLNRIISGGKGGVSIDHKQPKSKGGSNRMDNLQPTHTLCNLNKSDKWGKE